jgi:hypothetical protein
VSQAAQQYLALTAPANADLLGFLALPNNTTVAQAKTAAAKVAADEVTLVAALKKGTWPAAAQPTLTTLESTMGRELIVYKACATDTSITAIKRTLTQGQAAIAARAAASAQVRAALGVPAPTAPATNSATPSGSAAA